MALSETDREFIVMAAREGAFKAIEDSQEDQRRIIREEAAALISKCPKPEELRREIKAETKVRFWKILAIVLLAGGAGGAGGTLLNLPQMIKLLLSP